MLSGEQLIGRDVVDLLSCCVTLQLLIVTLWSKVTTPSLSMTFCLSWVQTTTSSELTRGQQGARTLLSLHISPLEQIVLFPFTLFRPSAAEAGICFSSTSWRAEELKSNWAEDLSCIKAEELKSLTSAEELKSWQSWTTEETEELEENSVQSLRVQELKFNSELKSWFHSGLTLVKALV